ncbi:hypothetical protein IWW50_001583 [Coemansia erecta]|nr:hypothetical protein GGF43_000342 [Coemansia sp. RSA 2618]KAJ2828049.1 hypothetical protein IWW50_001583 [Coemansia erecta]
MSKKQRRDSKSLRQASVAVSEANVERGNWDPQDADNFHYFLTTLTRFEADVLQLDHRYLDVHDIDEIDRLIRENPERKVSDDELIRRLEEFNGSNPNKDCRRWFNLLREMQAITGNRYTMRQLNTKHINTRSRWSVPFKSLNEVGFLIKNQQLRGVKRQAGGAHMEKQLPQRTNIEKKNLAAIKSIRKYTKYKDLFWDTKTQQVPTAEYRALVCSAHPEMDDVSEPERWIRAMIRRHHAKMVEYMDKCTVNLVNSYIGELNSMDTRSGPPMELVTLDDTARMKSILDDMVDVVLKMAHDDPKKQASKGTKAAPKNAKAKPKASKSASELARQGVPALDIPTQNLQSNGSSSSSVAGAKRAVTFSTGGDESGLDSSGSPTTAVMGSMQGYENMNHGSFGAVYHPLAEAGQTSMSVKRSKSHVFGKHSAPPLRQGHSVPSSMSHPDMYAYNTMPSLAGTLVQSSGAYNDSSIAPVQYEDGLFTQFLNYESMNASQASIGDIRGPRSAAKDGELAPAPAELVDAIYNLSVNAGAAAAVTGSHPGYAYMPHAIHDQLPSNPVQDQFPYYPIPQPVSAHADLDSKAPQANQLPVYQYATSYESQTPTALSRTTSDEKQQQQQQQGLPLFYPDSQMQKQYDAQTELQSIFGSKDSAFSFQVPPYNWPAENMAESNGGGDAQGKLSESFSMPSLASYARSASIVQPLPGQSPIGQVQSGSQTSSAQQQSLSGSYVSAQAPPPHTQSTSPSAHANTTKPHVVAQPLGQSMQGKSQLSTTLIIINGVPSHIELTHDNAGIEPNPIILPISQVIKEGN